MYNAAEVGPGHRLYDSVARLAQRAGLPQPRCYVIPDASPNAFATGRNPEHAAVAATEGMLQTSERRRAGRRAGPRARARQAPRHPDQLRRRDAGGGDHDDRRGSRCSSAAAATTIAGAPTRSRCIATMILAPIAAMLIQAAISRSREFDADAGGAAIAGGPHGLVSALQKDRRPRRERSRSTPTRRRRTCSSSSRSAARDLLGLFSTHPPTEKRIQALLAAGLTITPRWT